MCILNPSFRECLRGGFFHSGVENKEKERAFMNQKQTDSTLLQEIRKAYEKREITAYFQPIHDAVSGRMICAEALSRWVKADGTVIMPGDYIPELEASDAICEHDWYLLEQVCGVLEEQKQAGIPCVKISVNFSRQHIFDKNFVDKLCETVERHGVDPGMIQAEITETALCDNTPEEVDGFIRSIREHGFSVAMDDFGSGMSSLSMVKDVTMDTLKVDRSLLSKNCEDEKERIVLESILEFARRLKLVTVVEGVETKEQLGFLRTCGCKMIQGHLFAKAMPKEKFWENCKADLPKLPAEDILNIQDQTGAIQLLLDAVYTVYPLIIYVNLTRNSYYMMKYDDFTTKCCSSAGNFDECIEFASGTMAPEDRELFRNTFCIENQLAAYKRGEKSISAVVRQLGDDNIYRRVEITNFFVKNPSSEDVLAISLNKTLE